MLAKFNITTVSAIKSVSLFNDIPTEFVILNYASFKSSNLFVGLDSSGTARSDICFAPKTPVRNDPTVLHRRRCAKLRHWQQDWHPSKMFLNLLLRILNYEIFGFFFGNFITVALVVPEIFIKKNTDPQKYHLFEDNSGTTRPSFFIFELSLTNSMPFFTVTSLWWTSKTRLLLTGLKTTEPSSTPKGSSD